MQEAIAFDFDGVIHDYSEGYKDGSIYGAINQDVIEAIYELNKMSIPVFILSSREPKQIVDFWNKQGYKLRAEVIPDNTKFFTDLSYIGVTDRKLPAQLYIDDRALTYDGQTKKEILLKAVGKE